MTDRAQVEAGVARIEAEFGPIGILVNNAGMSLRAPLHRMEDEGWDAVLAVNLV